MSKITDIVNDIIVKTNANTSGQNIHNATEKETPVDADELAILDSANSFSLKKLTLANLKNVLFSSPALTGTPTAPTATAGTNTTQIATTAFVKSKSEADSIGVGQTWQNVTASRALDVTYTNSTGKPIFMIVVDAGGDDVVHTVYIDSVVYMLGGGSQPGRLGSFIVIPNGSTYKYTISGSTLQKWLELR